jgi:hypothetical protein
MGFLRGLFSGGGGGGPPGSTAGAPPAAETEYKGFMIRPAPRKEASGWLTVGVIVKQFPDGAKEHHFIRADTYQSHDDALAFCVTKAKQIIDEQGDKMFASTAPKG